MRTRTAARHLPSAAAALLAAFVLLVAPGCSRKEPAEQTAATASDQAAADAGAPAAQGAKNAVAGAANNPLSRAVAGVPPKEKREAAAAAAGKAALKTKVAALVAQLDKDWNAHDAEAAASHFSDDAIIDLSVDGVTGKSHHALTGAEAYARYLDARFADFGGYSVESSDVKVNLLPGGDRGGASFEMIESGRRDGHEVKVHWEPALTFRLEQGRLVLTSLTANGRSYFED